MVARNPLSFGPTPDPMSESHANVLAVPLSPELLTKLRHAGLEALLNGARATYEIVCQIYHGTGACDHPGCCVSTVALILHYPQNLHIAITAGMHEHDGRRFFWIFSDGSPYDPSGNPEVPQLFAESFIKERASYEKSFADAVAHKKACTASARPARAVPPAPAPAAVGAWWARSWWRWRRRWWVARVLRRVVRFYRRDPAG